MLTSQPGAARLGGMVNRAVPRSFGCVGDALPWGQRRTAWGDQIMNDRQSAPGVSDGLASASGLPPAALPAGTVVVIMPDEVVHSNSRQVGQELADAFAPGVTTVIADFAPNSFCDSSGIAALVAAHKRAAATGAAFRVTAPHPHLVHYLSRVGLINYLSIYPSLAEALRPGVSPQKPDGGVLTGSGEA